MKPLPRLYAIADSSFGDPVELARVLFSGGIRLLQVRNKKASARELLQQVDRILSFAPSDAKVIVNDRVDIALVAGAAGVHVGQTDLPPGETRKILGPDRTVGFSTHNLKQALEADQLPVDYIAVGPVFPTATKENPYPVVGVDNLRMICRAVRKPVVAIGGIKLENVREVLSAGAASIAVIRDILDCENVSSRVQYWMELLSATEWRNP
jgi:thiamine-phosphate pyrophosphorylase